MTVGISFYHEYSQPTGVLLIVSVTLWPIEMTVICYLPASYASILTCSSWLLQLRKDNSYFPSHWFYLMLLEKHLHSHIIFINTMINTFQCNWFPLWLHVLHFLCVKGTYNSKPTGTVGIACPFSVHTNLVSLWIRLWPNKSNFQNIPSHSRNSNCWNFYSWAVHQEISRVGIYPLNLFPDQSAPNIVGRVENSASCLGLRVLQSILWLFRIV